MKYCRFLLLLSLLFTSCSNNDKELHLYSWGDYINPEVIKKFEQKYNCKVVIDSYESNEAMYSKLKSGASGYDIIFPSNYILNLLNSQSMLEPIDKSKIDNLKNLDTHLLDLINVQIEDNSIPYMMSYSGLGYRKDKIKEMIPSWNVFAHKAWKGRMTMLNDYRETIGAGLKYLGYSINSRNDAEIDQAVTEVLKWKKNLAKFESEQYKNGIASAEFLVVHGYSGDILQVMQEDPAVGFIYPEEGAIIACDFLAIPKGAKEIELAHEFINFLYEPKMSALNIQWTFYLCPNAEAYKYLSHDLKNNHTLFPSDEILQKMELIIDVGPDIIKYRHAWDKIKSE